MSAVSPAIKYNPKTNKLITLAGGCFWGLEPLYRQNFGSRGLIDARVGFSNGNIANPSYKRVCEGDTNHAEALQVSYDPTLVSLRELLDLFFRIHDPTTVNSQGADKGTQYRSAIFTHSDEDLAIAKEVKEEFQPKWGNKIVTEVAPIISFYDAEEYHQKYLDKNADGYHCSTHYVRKF